LVSQANEGDQKEEAHQILKQELISVERHGLKERKYHANVLIINTAVWYTENTFF
jgi:hypothetical protein